jgi:hypothetical protein
MSNPYTGITQVICDEIAAMREELDALKAQHKALLEICNEEIKRGTLVSYPLKFKFAEEKGFDSIEYVHEWMSVTRMKFEETVKEQYLLQSE